MKISNSSITIQAETSSIETHKTSESLTMWERGGKRRTVHGDGSGRLRRQAETQAAARQQAVQVTLSSMGAAKSREIQEAPEMRPSPVDDLKLDILKAMIEKLTGKKIEIMEPDEIYANSASPEDLNAQEKPPQGGQQQNVPDFGMIYEFHESHYQYQSLDFSASGTITTADGKEVEFSVNLSMSREFYSEHNIELRAGEALKDPLAVNFSGTAAELSDTTFEFDIDADGTMESISFLRPGSGFLALDKNGDNQINNGNELFGALTGDGFEELAAFDQDGNGFIDENDAVFSKLKIWQKGSDGTDRLIALGRAGVGAIYLGKAASPFDMRDANNELAGRIKSTGFFLREDGSAGTVQQIDLVV